MIRPGPHAPRRAVSILLLMLLLTVLTLPAAWAVGEGSKDKATDTKGSSSAGYPIGVYVTSLRDFDTVGDSFGIDFWVWSVHAPGDNPLQSVEFVNAKQLDIRLDRTSKRGDKEWSRRKVTATVLHHWNLNNFPFDHQTLTTDLGISTPGAAAYRVDRTGSGYGKHIAPDG